jgi:hypothetical protein
MRGLLRWGRGCTVGLAIVVLACVGHVSGGGTAHVGPLLLAALLAAAAAVGGTLSGHEWSVSRLVAVLAAAQAVCHVVLTTSMASEPATMVSASHRASAPAMSGMVGSDVVRVPSGVAVSSSAFMLAAHAAAIAATALVLHRMDSWALRVAEFVSRRWSAPRARPRPVVLAPLSVRVPTTARVPHLVDQLRLTDVTLRGPPRLTRLVPVPAF